MYFIRYFKFSYICHLINQLKFKMESSTTQKKEGIVKFFNATKGFGFIKESDGTEIFVHATGLIDKIAQDDHVSYNTKAGKKGINAVDVQRI